MDKYDIGRTLSRTFNLMMTTLGSVGLFLLIIQVVSAVMQFALARPMLRQVTDAQAAGDPAAGLALFSSGTYLGITALSMLLGSFAIAGSLNGLIQTAWGKPTSLQECFSAGLAKMLPALGVYVLWGLGVGLGSVLLIVPGLILVTVWSVAMPAVAGENRGVFESFGRSRELTRGSRWQIFFTLLLVVIAMYAVIFVILGAIFGVGMMQIAAKMNSTIWGALISVPIGWVFGSLINALLASIYVELVSVREGKPVSQLSGVFE